MIPTDVILLGLITKHGVREGVREWLRAFPSLQTAMDGGEGSGNFEHEGRPGKVGGSGESGGKQQEEKKRTSEQYYQQAYERILSEVTPEVRKKMESVKIDFTRDNILPEINKEDAEVLGVEAKPVRLKTKIINRQEGKHLETKEYTNFILSTALYDADIKLPGKTAGYMHFIKQFADNAHSLVLLDLKESIDGYFDIVHYFTIDDRNKRRILRNTNKKTSTEGR